MTTILGLGPMGQALAGALLDVGEDVTVWNRSPGKAAALVARGAQPAATPAEAIAASPLTIACVIDYDAVHAIVGPAAAQLTGRTLVNLTADSPDRARETAEWAAGHGIDYLDGAIMTPTTTIGGEDALVLYSGPEALFRRHEPTLRTLGRAVHVGEDAGRAAAHDVALLDLFWTSMSGLVHAFALARAEGVTPREIAPFMGGIAELLPAIAEDFAQRIEHGDHAGDEANVRSAAAGMEHILHAAERRGLDSGVLAAAHARAQAAVDDGHGDADFSLLAERLAMTRA